MMAQLEYQFRTQDGGVDLLRMAKTLSAAEFREYINAWRMERKQPKPHKPGRFNA